MTTHRALVIQPQLQGHEIRLPVAVNQDSGLPCAFLPGTHPKSYQNPDIWSLLGSGLKTTVASTAIRDSIL